MSADTPVLSDLRASVEALYRLAPDRVPKRLLVCHCPVCMTPETLAQIIATPVRDLSPDLIREYSNSAHGYPFDPDDLNALLPRYLDLMAQDIEVDYNSVGADLRRFGEARLTRPGFPAPGMASELDRFARLLLLHFGALQVAEAEVVGTPWMFLEILIVGGWSVATVTAALDDLFAQPDIGRAAMAAFLVDVARSLRDGRLEIWALSQYRADAAPGLVAWLEKLLNSTPATDIFTDPDLSGDALLWLPSLAALRGRLTAEMLAGTAARA